LCPLADADGGEEVREPGGWRIGVTLPVRETTRAEAVELRRPARRRTIDVKHTTIFPEAKPPPERPPGRITQGVRGRLEQGAIRRERDTADWLRNLWNSSR
jgi:hypothetical protein